MRRFIWLDPSILTYKDKNILFCNRLFFCAAFGHNVILRSSVKFNQLYQIPDKVRIDPFLHDQDDYCFWTGVNITNEVSVSPVQNLSGLAQCFQLFYIGNQMCRIGPLNLALIILGNVKNWLYIGPMKNLVIHPKDPTTEFLSPIYANLKDKTVVTGGITKPELRVLIEIHDRILILGHGFQYGLVNPGQFPGAGLFIIDDSMAPILREKSSGIFIWCHADQYARTNCLSGLCSGMFISSVDESILYGYEDIDSDLIEQSNERFAAIMSKWISEPLNLLYDRLLVEYSILARSNPIAKFNLERLCLCGSGVLYRAN